MQLTWKTGEWKDAKSRELKFGIKKEFSEDLLGLITKFLTFNLRLL